MGNSFALCTKNCNITKLKPFLGQTNTQIYLLICSSSKNVYINICLYKCMYVCVYVCLFVSKSLFYRVKY